MLRKHLETAKRHMAEGTFLVKPQYNEHWVCYLSGMDDGYSIGMNEPLTLDRVAPELVELSGTVPVLLFSHPEDHGWRFDILSNGRLLSGFELNYEEAMLSPEEVERMRNDPILAQIGYRPALFDPEACIAGVDAEDFRLFELDDERIGQLRELFVPENLTAEKLFGVVRSFQSILGFDMDFVGWKYLPSMQEDDDLILARA